MSRRSAAITAVAILLSLAIGAGAAADAEPQGCLTAFRSIDIASTRTGRTYRIFVHVPDGPAPAHGYPVFTMTDGNEGCPLAAAIASTISAYILERPLIVCVGYPASDRAAIGRLRVHDLIDAPQTPLPAGSWSGLAAAGGADAFSDFLQQELKPLVARLYHVDPSRQALFGHSLGGWFVLREFLVHPDRYQTYIAGSPSLWWNTTELYADLDRAATGAGTPSASRLLLEVGSLEDAVDEAPPTPGRRGIEYRMVDHFNEIARRLAQRMPQRSRTRLIDGESHTSALAPELDHGLVFAFGRS